VRELIAVMPDPYESKHLVEFRIFKNITLGVINGRGDPLR
jgi:hypothetical protein